MSAAWFIIFVVLFYLTVFRVTRFFIQDTWPPIAWMRNKITGRRSPDHWLSYLFGQGSDPGCPWCMSVWVAAAGCVILWLTDFVQLDWRMWVMLALSASTATGFLAQAEKE